MQQKYIIALSDEEKKDLEANLRTRKSSTPVYRRSQMLLAMDKNGEKVWKDHQIAEAYNVSTRQCIRLRKALCEDGMELALNGKPLAKRPPAKFDGTVEANLIALRCSDPPEGYSSWTLRLLAGEMVRLEYVESISHEGVNQLLKKTKSSRGKSNPGSSPK